MKSNLHFMKFLFSAVLLLTAIPASAAILTLQPSGPETIALTTTLDTASYFLLEQSTDLQNFSPFSMVLGSEPRTYSLSLAPDDDPPPSRFFRAKILSAYAPSDTDDDGIDDIYEIRHPVLNPLDPNDASRDPDNNGLSYRQEYLAYYDLGDGKREAISDEVSVFTTRPFIGPAVEALSDEVSVFTTRPFTGPEVEAISDEVSVFTTRPFTGPTFEAISDEVSLKKTFPSNP